MRRVAALFVLLVTALANEAAGQPNGWAAHTIIGQPLPSSGRSYVSIVNLATGVGVASFDVPTGISDGSWWRATSCR